MLESGMRNYLVNKILWIVTFLLALVSAITGVIYPQIYNGIMPGKLIPATLAQDWLTIIVSMTTLGLILKTKAEDVKKQITIIGIVSSIGYLYAIYSMERIYTVLYLVYLAILGLTLYAVPVAIGSLNIQGKWTIPNQLRIITTVFSTAIAIIFSTLWIGALIPILGTGQTIELYYSIYILDLAWIMPGFVITAVLSYKKKTAGYLLTPIIYILGIFVIFPLGLGELAKPFFGQQADVASMSMSFVLAGVFAALSGLILKNLEKVKR